MMEDEKGDVYCSGCNSIDVSSPSLARWLGLGKRWVFPMLSASHFVPTSNPHCDPRFLPFSQPSLIEASRFAHPHKFFLSRVETRRGFLMGFPQGRKSRQLFFFARNETVLLFPQFPRRVIYSRHRSTAFAGETSSFLSSRQFILTHSVRLRREWVFGKEMFEPSPS